MVFSKNFFKKGQGDQHSKKKFLKICCTFWYINRPMLENKIFLNFLLKFFPKNGRFVYVLGASNCISTVEPR